MASDRCKAFESDLIMIDSKKELEWLLQELRKRGAQGLPPKIAWWVGLVDKGKGAQFMNGSNIDTSFLAVISSSSLGTTCGSVSNRSILMTNCTAWMGFICERDKNLPLKCEVEEQWVFINGSCVKYFSSPLPWSSAQRVCNSSQSSLVKVTTSEQISFIWDKAKVSSSASWIGFQFNAAKKRYEWTDGSPTNVSIPWWSENQPVNASTNASRLCGVVDGNNKRLTSLGTQNCNVSYPFTCEKPEGVCPDGWIRHQEMCFKFFTNQKFSWTQSKFYCSAMGANILQITRQSFQNVINSYFKELRALFVSSIWIGASDDGSGQQFIWSDGTEISYTNWALKPPASVAGVKRFGFLNTSDADGKWQLQDGKAVTRRAFACSIPTNKPLRDLPSTNKSLLCDEGWEVAGDSCVYISDNDATYMEAQQACLSLKSQLVVINSQDIHGYMTSRIQTGAYWTGLNDRNSEGKFLWSNNIKLTITYWADGQPDNKADENCVILKPVSSSVRWFDVKCSDTYSYICQKPPVNANDSISTTTEVKGQYSAKCGSMWEERAGTDWCYQFRLTKLTWHDANDLCTFYNGSLASITSKEEQSYFEGIIRSYTSVVFWIGASDRLKEAGWQWIDGSPLAYLNWDRGEPNNLNDEDCAGIKSNNYRWNDFPCNIRNSFICKKRADSVAMSTVKTTPRSVPSGQYFGCPPGWLTYNYKCYLIRTDSVKWLEAEAACKKESSELASVHSKQENDFIWSQLPKDSCEDLHLNSTECDVWVRANECQKNPQWMLQNCKKSCSFCNKDCHDKYTQIQCQYWARVGECTKNSAWMWANCAQSCGCNQDINNGYWLGLSDLQSQMSFSWTDYSSVVYTNWQLNEPNNYIGKNEDCIQIHSVTGQWSDDICDVPRTGYVCKKPLDILDKPTIAPNQIGCPARGFGYGSTCYIIYDTPRSWLEAQADCIQINGQLATVSDSITNAFITSELVNKESSYWIGLSDKNGTYMWSSGSMLQYTIWAPSHTGNEWNTCVAIRSQRPVGLWENLQCQQQQPYVCETLRQGFVKPAPPTVPSATSLGPCPPQWNGLNGLCYRYFTDKKTWFEAQARCETFGGNLTSIHNSATQQFVISSTVLQWRSLPAWIGLSDAVSESNFQWIDGSSLNFSNWKYGEPNNSTVFEDCVELVQYSGGQWNDNHCYVVQPFFCTILQGATLPSVVPALTPTPSTSCADPSWQYFNGSCYYLSSHDPMTWYQARQKCLSSGGDLVSILSEDENNFLITWLSRTGGSQVWIGFNQLDQEEYVWSDGMPTNFVAWGRGEPNDGYGAERCVDLSGSNGYWIDDNCNTNFGYICKKSNNSNAAIVVTPTPLIDGNCPYGFVSEVKSNKCYFVGGLGNDLSNDPKLGWIQARDFCRNLTSPKRVDIGSINSLQDQETITMLFSTVNSDMWIGLSDLAKRYSYSWQDNSQFTYTNWVASESQPPYSYWQSGNCVAMLRNPKKADDVAKWNKDQCSKKNAYLCQTMKAPSSTVPSTTSSSSTCPSGYVQYKNTCYLFVSQPQTWDSARSMCQAQGGDLASTLDTFEVARVDLGLYNSDISDPAWIGMRYSMDTLVYYWTDHWPVQRTFWSSGNPDLQTNSSCVAFSKAEWNDTNCDQKLPYVCEIRKDTPPPTTPVPLGHCANNTKRFGVYCYLIKFQDQLSWPEAAYTCGRQGMQLASIQSAEELQFLRDEIDKLETEASTTYFTRTNFWIGLNRDSAGGFGWTDNSPTVYFNWAQGEPSLHVTNQYSNTVTEEECVEMYRESGQWNDLSCIGNKQGYICKTSPVYPTTLSTTTTVQPTVTYSDPFLLDSTQLTSSTASTRQAVYHLPSTQKYSGSNKLTGGQIAGIVIGILGACIIIAAIVFIVWKRYPVMLISKTSGSGYDNALFVKDESLEVDVEHDQSENKVSLSLEGSTVKLGIDI
uniref:Macrophage mannose receptor 1-like n=1 Tax=Biomphalaria glabrata TaxID=6526 RepID=A0A2C9KE90_BIOGL